jgi:hypothetical protein
MRVLLAATVTFGVALALAGCGSGAVLHGTFTEVMYGDPTSQASCTSQEFGSNPSATWKIQIAADNVDVGTTAVHWSGSPYHTSICKATWSMSVPSAQEAYQVTLIAVCGDSVYNNFSTETIASATVQSSAAGRPVSLSDASAGGSNC